MLGRRWWSSAAVVLGVLALGSGGCESRVSLGAACTFASDCAEPYVCGVGGRCREQCATSRDCPLGGRCLVDVAGVRVCSLATDTCTAGCAAGLECVEGQCQSRCTMDPQCPDGECSPSGVCVVPSLVDAGGTDAGTTDAFVDPGACRADVSVLDVDVGLTEVCAVTADGEVYCWGYFLAVGPDGGGVDCAGGPGACYPRPVRVAELGPASQVAVGAGFACAILEDRSVWCWGSLDGSAPVLPAPMRDDSGVPLVASAIEAGRTHACVVVPMVGADPSVVRCWGNHDWAALGDGIQEIGVASSAVEATELPVGTLALGGYDTFSWTASGVTGVGENNDSELGVTSTPFEPMGVTLAITGALGVGAGLDHTCVLDAGGHPSCWGRLGLIRGNDDTPLVACESGNRCTPMPTLFDASPAFVGIALDPFGETAIAWTSAGEPWGWGSSWGWLLSDENVARPTRLTALAGQRTRHVAIGNQVACAILEGSETLGCWGLNDAGQLGRGTVSAAAAAPESERFAEPPCW